ncbi:hypothetical protein [Sulfurospirillum cavolei]|nr:hypothetical protein [Sulfurospirillum cavolei]
MEKEIAVAEKKSSDDAQNAQEVQTKQAMLVSYQAQLVALEAQAAKTSA